VKAHYVFGNDSMKMRSNTKQEWRLTIELKILKLCTIAFLSSKLSRNIFCHEFFMFVHAHNFYPLLRSTLV
jgi:hypothetical protein